MRSFGNTQDSMTYRGVVSSTVEQPAFTRRISGFESLATHAAWHAEGKGTPGMSVTTRVVFRDDYTGEDIAPNAANQRILILDGVKYELDFSASSNEAFDKALAPFIRNAKGVRLSDALYKELVAADTSRTTPVESKTERQAIRLWWEQNWKRLGLPQPGKSGRGRIHAVVRDAYYAQTGGEG